MKNIRRRKPIHSHSLQNLHSQGNSNPLTDSERQGYTERIDRLRTDKETVIVELSSQIEEQRQLESEVQLLRDLLQNMDLKQNQMLSCLSEKLQKPEAGRKRRLHYGESGSEDSLTRRGSPDSVVVSSVLGFDMELLDSLESSLCLWENILNDLKINDDVPDHTNSSDTDMNCEVSAPTCVPCPDTVTSVAQGVNDVFWEQFLTENPGSSSQAQEGQLGSKDQLGDGKVKENNSVEYGKYWWNKVSGNSLQDHLGQLTAGRS